MARSTSILAVAVVLAASAGCSAPDAVATQLPPDDTTETVDTAYTVGTSHFGTNDYVEYIPGDLPIILSAPHGGDLTPNGIPDRVASACGGSATTVKDLNTRELTLAIADSVRARFGGEPHVIINHLHRRKLDANRPLVEAACGVAAAERAWREYQGYVDRARDAVEQSHGRGWFMDMHGHGHEIQRLELGYLLSRSELNGEADDLEAVVGKSSLLTLAEDADASFAALLRGEHSLGALYAAGGFPAVPSPDDPAPGSDPYFTGGYNTRRHTCGSQADPNGGRTGGGICGVQIEANRIGVRDTEENRARFAGVTAAAVETFLSTHWALSLQPATHATAY